MPAQRKMNLKLIHPLRVTTTFGIAAAFGWLLESLSVPLPWLLGPLIGSAALALGGAPAAVWGAGRKWGQVMVGLAVGLHFTPEIARMVSSLSGIMIAVPLVSILFAAFFSMPLAKISGIDRATAYFASMPGGVAEMSILAERHGGDTTVVLIGQTLRIVCTVLIIPPALQLINVGNSPEIYSELAMEVRPALLAAMMLAAASFAYLLNKVSVPNSWLLAGLMIGALIGFLSLQLSGFPGWLLNIAQALIGAALGVRFRRDVVANVKASIPYSLLGTLVLLCLAVVLAFWVQWSSGTDFLTAILATAPGGVAEMSITASVLGLGVPTVIAFHLVRILVVLLLCDPLFIVMRRYL